jgi:transcriptional regulator with XRE-family HTH domain
LTQHGSVCDNISKVVNYNIQISGGHMSKNLDNGLFSKIFKKLLYYMPFIQADIAKMLEVAEATVTKWYSGESLPDGANLVKLIHILLGIDEKCLLGFTNKAFANGRSLKWQRENVPQGEKDLLPYVQLVTKITQKAACSVYRYNPEENVFVTAAYFRYGCGLKTKFRYSVSNENTWGDGVTGNIIRRHNGQLIIPNRKEQLIYLPDRTTKDRGAFLIISVLKNQEGKLLGCVKIEDIQDGSKSDIKSSLLDDILTMGRIFLENTGFDNNSREWWKLRQNIED